MIYRTLFGSPNRRFRSPFEEMANIRRRMERLMEEYGDKKEGQGSAGVYPAVNITEDMDAYYISAELPGVQSSDLDLNVAANQVTIVGERKISQEAADARYHRREREAGKFSRAVALPGDIDAESTKAKLAGGVLTITVPKAERTKPKRISIQ